MKRIYGNPTPASIGTNLNNGIHQVVHHLATGLPEFGYEVANEPVDIDLIVQHAGNGHGQCDVAICHGLHPTGDPTTFPTAQQFEINRRVIADVVAAKAVIVPSQWVADILRRDMYLDPHVIEWGVMPLPPAMPAGKHPTLIWNKNREDGVCTPQWMQQLAQRLPHCRFLSTFGNPSTNVKIVGRKPHDQMIALMQGCHLYLATTKETGDIGSREALTMGIPVVGFNWGAVKDVVEHGVTGYLAVPQDLEDLQQGVLWALEHYETLRANALRRKWPWQRAVEQVARIFDEVLDPPPVDVSVVIPCHNYAQFVGEAIQSVAAQETSYRLEVVVVDDGSTDNSWEVIEAAFDKVPFHTTYYHQSNEGVAAARNHGLEQARGELAICLDADDLMAPTLIQVLADALQRDRALGVAYSRLRFVSGGMTDWLSLPFNVEQQLEGFNQIPTCAMFRRADALRVGGYRQYMAPAEDADLFTRLIWYTGKRAEKVTEEPLFLYRQHPDSVTAHYRAAGRGPDPFRRRTTPKRRPIAAPNNGDTVSHPVYSFDNPLVGVTLIGDGDVQATLDDLQAQSYWNWIAAAQDNAPFVKSDVQRLAPLQITLEAGTRLPPTWLQETLVNLPPELPSHATIGVMTRGCCGGIRPPAQGSVLMNEADFVLVEYRLTVTSPVTEYLPATAKATGSAKYQMVQRGQRMKIHRDDYNAHPNKWGLIQQAAPQVQLHPIPPAPPMPTIAQPPKPSPPPAPTKKKSGGITISDAAELLNVSESTVRKYIRENNIEPVETRGRAYLYDPADFQPDS